MCWLLKKIRLLHLYTENPCLVVFTLILIAMFPLFIKKGLIFCLLFRIYNIYSLWSLIHGEISKLKCILVKNKYPVNLINFCRTKYLDTLFCKKASVATVPQKEIRVVLPFMGKYTNVIKNKLIELFSNTFPSCKLKFVFQCGRKIGSLRKSIVEYLFLDIYGNKSTRKSAEVAIKGTDAISVIKTIG